MTQPRSPWWDPGRFVKTLSFFGAVPFLSEQEWFQTLMGSRPHPTVALANRPQPNRQSMHNSPFLLVDFANPTPEIAEMWGALDDVVMGGVSESSLRLVDGTGVFGGVVSTANSGGFASVRSRNIQPPLDLSGYTGMELRLKGDGQRYKFFVRTETQWDGLAHCYSFDTTADEWMTIQMPFCDFVAVFRARTVSDRPINPSHVVAFQLMLSKFEYDGALNPHFAPGAFHLHIAAIGVY
ncbi:MAG: CIA30 family protein [Kaiparowitsia implicata GSE-PSE-MK54-09C]|jgi:hypothetical protein|nr:CIA30 family protein [Kaiparowitsia implicata GSE-PSE-MK54-09C]